MSLSTNPNGLLNSVGLGRHCRGDKLWPPKRLIPRPVWCDIGRAYVHVWVPVK